jgi:hypothetical protein
MQHLEVSGAVVLYIGRTVSKGLNLKRITGTLHENQYTLFIVSRSVLPRKRNVSDKRRGNRNIHFLLDSFFLRKSFRL